VWTSESLMELLKKTHTCYLLLMRLLNCSWTWSLYIFRWFFWIPSNFHSTKRPVQNCLCYWLGGFCMVVMPFGVKNRPPTYQRTITKTFCEYIDVFMKFFLDDFTIFSDLSTHLEKFIKCFLKCREYHY
jgi:hypothetical protein